MRSLLSLLLAVALIPAGVAALGGPLPVPPPFPTLPADCPAVVWVDGVAVIPADAPADCVYIQALPSGDVEESADPCAPDASGAAPLMCQSGLITPNDERSTYQVTAIALTDGGTFPIIAGELSFGNGALQATVGCNQIRGGATMRANGALDILQLMSTEMYCPELDAAERALINVLNGGNLRLVTSDTTTQLESSSGTIILVGGSGAQLPGATTTDWFALSVLVLLLIVVAVRLRRERRA